MPREARRLGQSNPTIPSFPTKQAEHLSRGLVRSFSIDRIPHEARQTREINPDIPDFPGQASRTPERSGVQRSRSRLLLVHPELATTTPTERIAVGSIFGIPAES
jgi:hypothetical protein